MFFPRFFLLYLLLSFAPVKMKNIRTIPRSKELSMNGMRILKKDLIQLKHKASWFSPLFTRLLLRFFLTFYQNAKRNWNWWKSNIRSLILFFSSDVKFLKELVRLFFLLMLVETKFRSYNLNFLFLFLWENYNVENSSQKARLLTMLFGVTLT